MADINIDVQTEAGCAQNAAPEVADTPDKNSILPKPEDKPNKDNPETKKNDQSIEDTGNASTVDSKNREHTRSTMALLFVLGFFALLFLCFAYALIVNAELKELKDTLVAVIGALSGIFGFIVGYYYKSSQDAI